MARFINPDGDVADPTGFRLLVNYVAPVITPPVYDTLTTLTIETLRVTSFLRIDFTAAAFHTGPSAANGAMNIRLRLNGTLLVGGMVVNTVRSRIMPLAAVYPRIAVTRGVQTVDVELSLFGALGNNISILPVTNPDLWHANLSLEEQR